MANDTHEPRALGAALAGPAFATRGGGLAMHVADRHVERWAPETSASRVRSMRSLGFVDRLIAPWMETAQRSASLRLFTQYAQNTTSERAVSDVSWVFPRPWYQDELDWMTAARQAPPASASPSPSLFTTRGTYVAPEQRPQRPAPMALSPALYEYIAPSLSIAAEQRQVAGVGFGGGEIVGGPMARSEPYSPLVSLAAVQAAEVMSRAVERLPGATAAARMSPGLRSVLSTMLTRANNPQQAAEPTRLAMQAPELVTPPAPRAETPEASASSNALQVAERYAEQRVQIVELQRIARQSAEREITARAVPRTETTASTTADVRAAAVRTEAELRQRAGTVTQTQTEDQRRAIEQATAEQTAERVAATERTAERTRVEERVAQRIAERTGAQRLHEQARSQAAEDARAAAIEPIAQGPGVAPSSERRAPAEVAAAIAALPPELASFLGRRPDRAVQAIDELNEALRTVELIARNAAMGGTFESPRGPRLMMPAGLGGLVAAVDRAHTISDRPAALAGQRMLAPLPAFAAAPEPRAQPIATRPSSLPWLTMPRTASAATSALGATASAPPAALSHVAWADRWLARFAGASPQSLDALSASARMESGGLAALAAAAPGSVFVSPSFFDAETDRPSVRAITAPTATAVSAPALARRDAPSDPSVVRYDDDAETPDDVFAAISQTAARQRTTAASAPSAPSAAVATRDAAVAFERTTLADAVAHTAPMSPGAGFSSQLASSPFASALRHVLPLPAATTFDVRSLFGAGLSASYLAGLFAPASHEIEIGGGRAVPAWARWSVEEGAGDADTASVRAIPEWDPAYVAPSIDEMQSAIPEQATAEETVPTGMIAAPALAPITTLRSTLLAWEADTAADAAPPLVSRSQSITTSTARSMVEAMSLPLLGDAPGDAGDSWAAPGMIADRAHSWSVAQERSSSDLAFDFVTPELVLAARVYGLGPAEAAQAARLAIAGPGQLSAMAGAVDRTFVQAMAIEADRREAERRERGLPIKTAFPLPRTGDVAVVGGAPAPDAYAVPRPELAASTGSAFGVDRRHPRGAFLWPSATIAALGLNAAAPDGQQSMSVAALELLAAQAVAELGTYAALSEPAGERTTDSAEPSARASVAAASTRSLIGDATRGDVTAPVAEPSESDVLGAAAALIPGVRRARFDALYIALSQSPAGRTWSPAARAARALALAGRGDEGVASAHERAMTAWDVLPVVFATDGIRDEAMPVLAGSARGSESEPGFARSARPGRAFARSGELATGELVTGEPSFAVDVRPGLAGLSARAGEALGSYVTPLAAAPAPSSSSSSSSQGAVLRAPTAAQEMVQTGRPSGRYGGGEVEIPAWFEAAARRMFETQQGSSSAEGISLAELTLIQSTPSHQIAASAKTPAAAAPVSPGIGSAKDPKPGQKIDIDKIANEIYRQILAMMDAARARNGEPYL